MDLIVSIILILVFVQISTSLDCSLYQCLQCSEQGCKNCRGDGFQLIIDQSGTQNCKRLCQSNNYFVKETQKCVPVCPLNHILNTYSASCDLVANCPKIIETGSDFHQDNVKSIFIEQTRGLLITYDGGSNCEVQLWEYERGVKKATLSLCKGQLLQIRIIENLNLIIGVSNLNEFTALNYVNGTITNLKLVSNGQFSATSAIYQDFFDFYAISHTINGDFNIVSLKTSKIYTFSQVHSVSIDGSFIINSQNSIGDNFSLFDSDSFVVTYGKDGKIKKTSIKTQKVEELYAFQFSTIGIFKIYENVLNGQKSIYAFAHNLPLFGSDQEIIGINLLSNSKALLPNKVDSIYDFQFRFSTMTFILSSRSSNIDSFSLWDFSSSTVKDMIVPLLSTQNSDISCHFLSLSGSLFFCFDQNKQILRQYIYNREGLTFVQKLMMVNEKIFNTAYLSQIQMNCTIYDEALDRLILAGNELWVLEKENLDLKYKILDSPLSFRGHTNKMTRQNLFTDLQSQYAFSGSYDGSLIKWDHMEGTILSQVFHPDYPRDQSPSIIKLEIDFQRNIAQAIYADDSIVFFDPISMTFIRKYFHGDPGFYVSAHTSVITNLGQVQYQTISLNQITVVDLMTGLPIRNLRYPNMFFENHALEFNLYIFFQQNGNFIIMDLNDFSIKLAHPTLHPQNKKLVKAAADFIGFPLDHSKYAFVVTFDNNDVIAFNLNQTLNDPAQPLYFKNYKSPINFASAWYLDKGIILVCLDDGTIFQQSIVTKEVLERKPFNYPISTYQDSSQSGKGFFAYNMGQELTCVGVINLNQTQIQQMIFLESQVSVVNEERSKMDLVLIGNVNGIINTARFYYDVRLQLVRQPGQQLVPIEKIQIDYLNNIVLIASNMIELIDYQLTYSYQFNKPINGLTNKVKDFILETDSSLLVVITDSFDSQYNFFIWDYVRDLKIVSSSNTLYIEHHSCLINGILLFKLGNLVQGETVKTYLVSWDSIGEIVLWQYPTSSIEGTFQYHQGFIHKVIYVEKLQLLVSWGSLEGDKRELFIWEVVETIITKFSIKVKLVLPDLTNVYIDEENQRLFCLGTKTNIFSISTGIFIVSIYDSSQKVVQIVRNDEFYFFQFESKIQIYQRKTLQFDQEVTHDSKIIEIILFKDQLIYLGQSNNFIMIYNFYIQLHESPLMTSYFSQIINQIFLDQQNQVILGTIYTIQGTSTGYQIIRFLLTTQEFDDNMYAKLHTTEIENLYLNPEDNRMISQSKYEVVFWKYYSFLGKQGQYLRWPLQNNHVSFHLPSSTFNSNKLFQIDAVKNLMTFKNNELLFIKELPYQDLYQSVVLKNTLLLHSKNQNQPDFIQLLLIIIFLFMNVFLKSLFSSSLLHSIDITLTLLHQFVPYFSKTANTSIRLIRTLIRLVL